MRISTFQVFWYWTDCNLIKIVYLCTRKSAGIDFTLNANTIKREKEVVHSLHDLASLYTVSVLHQIIAEKFGKVIGGGYLCWFEIQRENEKEKCN